MEWNIQSRAHACQACRKPFVNREIFHTLLYDRKASYDRLDVCQQCWNSQFSHGATERKGFISYWQSQYSPPPAGPPDPIQRETAETLLRSLLGQNEAEHAAARFILAAMLERKRLLKAKAQILEEGRRVFVYEHAKTGDLFRIVDPNLRLDQLEAVQQDVARLLARGVEPSPPAAEEAKAVAAAEQPRENRSGAETVDSGPEAAHSSSV